MDLLFGMIVKMDLGCWGQHIVIVLHQDNGVGLHHCANVSLHMRSSYYIYIKCLSLDVSELSIELLEAWSYMPVMPAVVTIRVVDSEAVTLYQRISATENTMLIVVPPNTYLLISVEADGYLPSSASYYTHHLSGQILTFAEFCCVY